MAAKFEYTPARWNRLSRSIRRIDDDVVEIRNATYAVGKMMLNLVILGVVLFMFAHLFIISGDRVWPNRPSSFGTLKEMIYEDYIYVTDYETYLMPGYEQYLEKRKTSRLHAARPLRSFEEYYESAVGNAGRTPGERLNKKLGDLDLGLFIVYLMLFVPVRLLTPNSNGIRLDSKRRVAYVLDWCGYSIKRFFGLADLRPNKNGRKVEVLKRLHFTTDLNDRPPLSFRHAYINKAYKVVFPFRKPPMIYLTQSGTKQGYTQRFPMGSYPMRKNQPEEIAQFIEDFFAHPDPGEWTKNLRYRYPLLSDPIVWLNRAHLWPFRGYNKAKTEAKIAECLKWIDIMR